MDTLINLYNQEKKYYDKMNNILNMINLLLERKYYWEEINLFDEKYYDYLFNLFGIRGNFKELKDAMNMFNMSNSYELKLPQSKNARDILQYYKEKIGYALSEHKKYLSFLESLKNDNVSHPYSVSEFEELLSKIDSFSSVLVQEKINLVEVLVDYNIFLSYKEKKESGLLKVNDGSKYEEKVKSILDIFDYSDNDYEVNIGDLKDIDCTKFFIFDDLSDKTFIYDWKKICHYLSSLLNKYREYDDINRNNADSFFEKIIQMFDNYKSVVPNFDINLIKKYKEIFKQYADILNNPKFDSWCQYIKDYGVELFAKVYPDVKCDPQLIAHLKKFNDDLIFYIELCDEEMKLSKNGEIYKKENYKLINDILEWKEELISDLNVLVKYIDSLNAKNDVIEDDNEIHDSEYFISNAEIVNPVAFLCDGDIVTNLEDNDRIFAETKDEIVLNCGKTNGLINTLHDTYIINNRGEERKKNTRAGGKYCSLVPLDKTELSPYFSRAYRIRIGNYRVPCIEFNICEENLTKLKEYFPNITNTLIVALGIKFSSSSKEYVSKINAKMKQNDMYLHYIENLFGSNFKNSKDLECAVKIIECSMSRYNNFIMTLQKKRGK